VELLPLLAVVMSGTEIMYVCPNARLNK